jgi:hypothetical protein
MCGPERINRDGAPVHGPQALPNTVQFTLASTIYFMLSMLFPVHKMMFDHAILEQDTLPDDGNISDGDEKKVDETGVA